MQSVNRVQKKSASKVDAHKKQARGSGSNSQPRKVVSAIFVALLLASMFLVLIPQIKLTQAGTIYLSGGFENDLSSVSINPGTLDYIGISTSYVIGGTKSLNLTTRGDYGYAYGGVYNSDNFSLTTASSRVYTNVSYLNINNGNTTTLGSLRVGLASDQLRVAAEIVYNGSHNVYQMGYRAGGATYHVPTSILFTGNLTDYWEITGVMSATVGEYQLYVNDVLGANVTGLNTGTTAMQTLYLGGVYGADMTAYYDNYVVSNEHNGGIAIGNSSAVITHVAMASINGTEPLNTRIQNTIQFDSSSSTSGWNGTYEFLINAYDWDFGDGTGSTTVSPYKTYSSAGTYLVSLTTTDTSGYNSTDTEYVCIQPDTQGYLNFSVSPNQAEYYKVGIQCSGNYLYWDRETWHWTPTTHNFTVANETDYFGLPAAKLELLAPDNNTFGTNRMQIYRDLNTSATYINQIYDFLLPETLPLNTTGQNFWYVLMDAVAERNYNNTRPYASQQFGIVIGILWNNGFSTSNYQYMPQINIHNIPTWVDNDDNGINDADTGQAEANFTTMDYLYGNDTFNPVHLGEWTRINVTVYRNPDYKTNPKGGFMQISWANLTAGGIVDTVLFEHNYTNLRTVGIWPEWLNQQTRWGTPNQNSNFMTLFNAGISNYEGGLLGGAVPYQFGMPNYIYGGNYSLNTILPADIVVSSPTVSPAPTATSDGNNALATTLDPIYAGVVLLGLIPLALIAFMVTKGNFDEKEIWIAIGASILIVIGVAIALAIASSTEQIGNNLLNTIRVLLKI